MTVSTISVGDMHCATCAGKIRHALTPLQGIQTTWFNPVRRQVLVEHDAGTELPEILSRIESAGFTPTLVGLDDHDDAQRALLKRLGIAGLAMMQVMMAAVALYAGAFRGMDPLYEQLLRYLSLVFTIPVVCYSAVPFFRNALASLRTPGNLSMDVPVALAIGIAFLASLHATLTGAGEVYFDSVVMFTFLLLGARYIDNRLQRRFDVSGQLLGVLPASVTRFTGAPETETRETVDLAAVVPGDHLWVGEGDQIPVDGNLTTSAADTSDKTADRNSDRKIVLDEALLTGESAWVEKQHQDRVFAGTLNRGAGFRMTATQPFDASRIADIAKLADRASAQSTRINELTDRIASIFVPVVLGLASLTFVAWQFVDPGRATLAALTVLVVSCPCALSLATPAALNAAMTRLRQLGIVLTDNRVLERIGHINRVFIDKTGTLTDDEPAIERIHWLSEGLDHERTLAMAQVLESASSHPYARAFRNITSTPIDAATAIRPVAGQGIEGQFATIERERITVRIGSAAFINSPDQDDRAVFMSIDNQLVARFDLTDRIRPDAPAAIQALRDQDVEPIMLSGDAALRCQTTAGKLGIPFLARHSPEDKLAAIRRAQQDGDRVLMIGDGINDVPVLAGADVSAAVVEASDLVKSRADVLLLSRKLGPLAGLFKVATKTRRVIRQNLTWAALYNLTAIPLAALGFMPPWVAALGMASSSILVMLNASRLLALDGQTMEDA